jgi:YegS/Rv2252/BmrU family lipid kinase
MVDLQRARRVLLIHNPIAGAQRPGYLAQILRELEALGLEAEQRDTKSRGEAESIAGEITRADCDVMAVAGGDGTINEVVNGMTGEAPPLAIVPMGTANVLAAEIGLTPAPAIVAATIARGRPARIHLGRANDRRFIMMAGAGFDADVVAHVGTALKRRIGKGAYVWQSLVELCRAEREPVHVRIGDFETDVGSVLAANGRYYGGRFVVAPDADLGAARLDVCLFEGARRLDILRYALALGTGRVARLGDVAIREARSIEISGPPGAPLQADGDIVATLPATIELEMDAIEILRPVAL